jgi:RHS repeat-associated protein
MGNPGYYVTNIVQQTFTNFYDAAGRAMTNINALGEMCVALSDAIGRPTQTEIFSSSGTLVRQSSMTYSADHNSFTVTDGSGASAISHTTYTDNDGHTVLSIAYPSSGATEFALNQFDLAGNLISAQHDSSASGTVTTWTTTSLAYDGLNRPISKSDRDSALTTYGFDPMGDLTNRTMPGGLQWQASYTNSGQMLQERNFEGGSVTRTTTYSYYSSGNPFAGLLQTKTDGRGTICTYSYDDWLRPTNMAYSGSLPEQYLTTTLQYEPRGYLVGITEQFASTNTGPATSVQRSFDAYGQLMSELVSAGSFGYGAGQSFDAAGRRSQLGIGSGSYGFGWQADGSLISASDSTGIGAYSYNTAGVLINRLVGNRMTSINSLDGEGRPLSIATTVNTLTNLTESLTWSGDGLLAADTLARADFTDSRAYAYASLSRRLVHEQLNLNGSTTWTNTMVYDNGVAAKPGVLTQMGQANSTANLWNGAADAFSRVSTETNNTYQFAAYGHVNGQATLSAWLDNQPVSVMGVGTNAMQWRAMMELSPGTHKLTVSALHPSGFYTAWATNSFTNSIAYQAAADTFDGAGNITNRVWKNPSGIVERTQTLSWDARGRLHAVTELNSTNSGYNWTATYDGLNRRLSTTTVFITNGVAIAALPTTINSYFDPQVEFLELGVSYGLTTEWKLYGPDLNGTYGGLNGTGGFDAVSPYLDLFNPTISDIRGDILGYYDSSKDSVTWNPSRPTGYGAVPDYRPVALANGANVAQSSAWRGRWVDITGFYGIGLRPYDPISGRWLTYDSAWNERDPNYYTFAGGDPINSFDSDGRIASDFYGAAAMQSPQYGTSDFTGLVADYYQGSGNENETAEQSLFGEALQSLFPNENLGSGIDDLSPQERGTAVNLMSWALGQSDSLSYAEPNRSVGSSVANAVWDTDLLSQSMYEFQHRDLSTGIGRATFVTAGVGLVFGGADAIANSIPIIGTGKALLEDAAKTGIKAVETTGEDAFAYYMKKAQTLDVSTERNGAVFYSMDNKEFAAQFAKDNGKTTIEMTAGGEEMANADLFNPNTSPLSIPQTRQVWDTLSGRFASGASGTATGFIKGADPMATFNRIESPALFSNPNVVNVITGGY